MCSAVFIADQDIHWSSSIGYKRGPTDLYGGPGAECRKRVDDCVSLGVYTVHTHRPVLHRHLYPQPALYSDWGKKLYDRLFLMIRTQIGLNAVYPLFFFDPSYFVFLCRFSKEKKKRPKNGDTERDSGYHKNMRTAKEEEEEGAAMRIPQLPRAKLSGGFFILNFIFIFSLLVKVYQVVFSHMGRLLASPAHAMNSNFLGRRKRENSTGEHREEKSTQLNSK